VKITSFKNELFNLWYMLSTREIKICYMCPAGGKVCPPLVYSSVWTREHPGSANCAGYLRNGITFGL